ncbi:MAG: redox-regulated ATPase YchF [Candidatus Bathyarchaeia archaeon]
MAPLVGLVGKANVGKSTFFTASTLKPVDIAGFPFTTIRADKGIAYLRSPCVCEELGVEDDPVNSACVDGVRLIPVDLIDTPGLIPGAHMGKGLGNQFLDEVRRADALIVVCDASGCTDMRGQTCEPGTNDPLDDVMMLEEEFDLWLLGLIKKDWQKVSRTAQSKKEPIYDHLEERTTGLGIDKREIAEAIRRTGLDAFKPEKWSEDEISRFITELRGVSKPLIVAANKADKAFSRENVERIRDAGYHVVPTCAEAELALRRAAEAGLVSYTPGDHDFTIIKPEELNQSQLKALEAIREKVFDRWGTTGVQEAIDRAFFDLLDVITVYPVEDSERLCDHRGRVLPDCYLVPRGTNAKRFAGMIHTDLEDTFLYAIDARTKKRLGEDYTLSDNDVIKIVATKSHQ